MQLKVDLKPRQELPRDRKEKGNPDEAKAPGKNADAGKAMVGGAARTHFGFCWLERTLAQRELSLHGKWGLSSKPPEWLSSGE